MNKEQALTREYLFYGLIFTAGLALRLMLLGRVDLVEYEASWAIQAWEILRGNSTLANYQVAYLSLTRLFFAILGGSDFAARLWPALIGSLVVWVPLLFRDKLGRTAAVLISLGLALDPALISVSRIGAGPMPALVFLLLASGAFHKRDLRLFFSFLVLGLLSGPGFWLGSSLLIIAVLIHAWLGVSDLKGYIDVRSSLLRDQTRSFDQALSVFSFPIGIFLLVGSFFFSDPAGLSAWAGALPAFISELGKGSEIQAVQLLIYLIVSNPFILVFGLLGFLQAWRRQDSIGIFSSVWFLIGLLVLLVVPGREGVDLIWLVIPLWIGAGREFLRVVRLAEKSWEDYGLAGLIVVLVVLNWLTFLGMVYQSGNQRAILLQIGLFLASFALVIISLLIRVGGSRQLWSLPREEWHSPNFSIYVGLGVVLLLFSFSSLTQGAYLRNGDSRSIWTKGSGVGQYDLLHESVYDASITQYGRGDVIRGIALVERDALRWALKDFDGIQFQSSFDQDNQPPIVITSDLDYLLVNQENYRGQDFVAATERGWDGILPPDWISWVAYRSGEIRNQVIILWIRNDIYSGY